MKENYPKMFQEQFKQKYFSSTFWDLVKEFELEARKIYYPSSLTFKYYFINR